MEQHTDVVKSSRVWRVIRNVGEALAAAALFMFQYVPNLLSWGMVVPMAVYIGFLLQTYDNPDLFFLYILPPTFTFEWALILVGGAIFLITCVQLLIGRGRLITSGLYSAVRHPQYLGLVLVTLGLSILSLRRLHTNPPVVVGAWLLPVSGYVVLAMFEERHLLREFGDDYAAYRQQASFLLPTVSRLTRLPEPFFSLLTVLIIVLLLLVLWNHLYYPTL